MPASLSSPIPAALAQLAPPRPLGDAEAGHLLAYLVTIPDPRAAAGRRHPLVAILALAAAAVLTGARSMAAIAEWAQDAPQAMREAPGARRDAPEHWVVPSEATIRRTLARLDAEALAATIGRWLADREGPTSGDGRSRWTARRCGAQGARAGKCTCWPSWSMPVAGCWPSARSTAAPARCPASGRCLRRWTWPGSS